MQEPQEMEVQSLGQEDTLEKGMETYSSILAFKNYPMKKKLSHGLRRLVGYKLWGCIELDMTEWLSKVVTK